MSDLVGNSEARFYHVPTHMICISAEQLYCIDNDQFSASMTDMSH